MDINTINRLRTAASNICPDSTDIYTIDMFHADFPQFAPAEGSDAGVPAGIEAAILAMANQTVNRSRWGDMWRLGIGVYIAHYITMYMRQNRGLQSAQSARQAADTGAVSGVISSQSLGDASISYDTSAASRGLERWGQYNLTTYGQQYASMAQLLAPGGMYVI